MSAFTNTVTVRLATPESKLRLPLGSVPPLKSASSARVDGVEPWPPTLQLTVLLVPRKPERLIRNRTLVLPLLPSAGDALPISEAYSATSSLSIVADDVALAPSRDPTLGLESARVKPSLPSSWLSALTCTVIV